MTLEEYFAALRGKRIAVVGLGVSNLPLVRLLRRYGCGVTACDKRSMEALGAAGEELLSLGCEMRLGEEYLSDTRFDVVFRTPGMHPNALTAFREQGAVITSEMEAFFALCPCRTVAITGSDGKTTTSTIIAELLREAGYRVWLGGNIGTPLLDKVPGMESGDIAVLELSSFQLHSMSCRPDRAVITNISPNHLDVHPSYEDYIAAKRQIFERQGAGDLLVVNGDNRITAALGAEARCTVRSFSRSHPVEDGVYCEEGMLYDCREGRTEELLSVDHIRIPGWHNVENYMAAYAAVGDLVGAKSFRRVAESFGGVRHRLEMLRTLRGVTYCNDSIASSPTRTIAGLKAVKERPILIAGGYDKHIPFDELGDEICRRVKALILTGDTAGKILSAVRSSRYYDGAALPIRVIGDFREAVLAASQMAEEGDLVLLSPGCASFDRFKNFAERGDAFRKIVMELK